MSGLCACIGPMYGEPHCICTMQRMGLPLNEPEREIKRANSERQLDVLFGPGGVWHRPVATIDTVPVAQLSNNS